MAKQQLTIEYYRQSDLRSYITLPDTTIDKRHEIYLRDNGELIAIIPRWVSNEKSKKLISIFKKYYRNGR